MSNQDINRLFSIPTDRQSLNRNNIRYCNCSNTIHHGSASDCFFASPDITSLVPIKQTPDLHNDGHYYFHYTHDTLHNASIKVRLQRRFETIENDRKEHMIDLLMGLDKKQEKSCTFLRDISLNMAKVENISVLLTQIVGKLISQNGSSVKDGSDPLILATLLEQIHIETTQLSKRISDQLVANDGSIKRIENQLAEILKSINESNAVENSIGFETNDKLDQIRIKLNEILLLGKDDKSSTLLSDIKLAVKQLVAIFLDNLEELKEAKNKIKINAIELASIKYEIKQVREAVDNNKDEIKNELDQMKKELVEIKSEVKNLCDAIINVLPNKLMNAIKMMNASDCSSIAESDIEVVNDDDFSTSC